MLGHVDFQVSAAKFVMRLGRSTEALAQGVEVLGKAVSFCPISASPLGGLDWGFGDSGVDGSGFLGQWGFWVLTL